MRQTVCCPDAGRLLQSLPASSPGAIEEVGEKVLVFNTAGRRGNSVNAFLLASKLVSKQECRKESFLSWAGGTVLNPFDSKNFFSC